MSNTEKSDERQGMPGDPPGKPLSGEQATALQRLLSFQSHVEEQARQVALAAKRITEALGNGGDITPEMQSHVKAQILKAHLQLDDLEEWLGSIS
jgi:hypothetical protein